MPVNKPEYTTPLKCGHCSNIGPMQVAAEYNTVEQYEDRESGIGWEAGDVYRLLACPACKHVILQQYYWHDQDDPEHVPIHILYPEQRRDPGGMPDSVRNEYEAASRVRTISPNAYAVLLGRVLDAVCVDRGASGDSLFRRLEDLHDKGEIPSRLVELAHGLRQLRNVGAHADFGNLGAGEVPFLDDLCRAVLEYVYSAPELIAKAQRRLDEIRAGDASGTAGP